MKTWQKEMLAAGIILIGIAIAGGRAIDFIGAAAVLFTFGHMSVSERLREKTIEQPIPSVECYRWLTFYLIAKEITWVAFFLFTGSYPALFGCALFLCYPLWRKFHRSRQHIQGA